MKCSMKKMPTYFSVLSLLLASLFFTSCFRDKCNLEMSYIEYTPIYMEYNAFVDAVNVGSPQDIKEPGKILVHGKYLFVNEVAKGIHVFNNEDPSAPVAVAFINIPGNHDLVSDCDMLYTDASMDLLIFDITNPENPVFRNRISNALPMPLEYRGYFADASKGVVVDWEGEVKTSKIEDCDIGAPVAWTMNQVNPGTTIDPNNSRGGTSITGIAGSASRFTISNKHLYVVTPDQIRVFNTTVCDQPSTGVQVELRNFIWGGDAETIFSYNNLLFIGSETGMAIFDINNPALPNFNGNIWHATGCDPVVADGNYAYVTIRSGEARACQGFSDQLDVVNISNPSNPVLERVIDMTNPYGLGIDDNKLFVCDGTSGLKVFDATNPSLQGADIIAEIKDFDSFDVIPNNGILVLVGSNGIVQYDYTDINNFSRLSLIPVVN